MNPVGNLTTDGQVTLHRETKGHHALEMPNDRYADVVILYCHIIF